ncbi:hypothetical protein M0R45_032408 [Rubus argutus]|uniref:Helicase ATP-binding domain-containing protein n=1 Tax=Rubus argutus TaxID=59490 RepID=A0AAW1WIN9_RUBAR
MKFQMEDVTVYVPYEGIYQEQYAYMVELKRALDAKGHCHLEMPTGTGKTIALLSLITGYILSKPQNQNSVKKLIYCTRTVHEMEKTLAELKLLHKSIDTKLSSIWGANRSSLSVSSRKNLCINHNILAASQKLTSSWISENPNVPTCECLEQFEKGTVDLPSSGVYSLQDLRAVGKAIGWCPFFLARQMVEAANVVVCTYQYLLDPKLAGIISKNLHKESIVVFDEAHSIDNACIEALSSRLETTKNSNVEKELLVGFVNLISIRAGIYQKTRKFCYDRLHSLMMTLEIIDTDEFLPIQTICNFATLMGIYSGRGGFSIIFEPTFDERSMQHDIPADPSLHLSCHDASLAIKPVFD